MRTQTRWKNYVDARNECVRIMRTEKLNYEKDIMDKCKSNPKLFYRHINGKMKKREGITGLRVDGKIYDQIEEMAEVMNERFQTVFTEEGDFDLEDKELDGCNLIELKVNKEEIMRLMGDLDVNKAPGPDGISTWILKECREQLADKIHSLVKTSLTQGRVPKDWKRANIVPIYKGGSREDPLNYRPVSLTSVVGKICEKVIKDAWMEHLESRNVLTDCQFGFRRGRSCSSNLL